MAAPSYLKQRRLGWYVQLAVPRAAQVAVGSKVLTRSLNTRDKAEAAKRRHAAIVELQSVIAQALGKGGRKASQGSAEELLTYATSEREAIESGRQNLEDAEPGFDAAADAFLEQQAKRLGRDAEGRPNLSPDALATVRRSFATLSGRMARSISRQVDRYLEESASRLRAQSIDDKRRHLSAFASWFGEDREPAEVTRKIAGTYVAEVIQRRTQAAPGVPADAPGLPLSAITRRKEISALRSYFDWLSVRGVVDSNPFDRMAATVKESSRGRARGRRPWKPVELSKVLRGVPSNDPMWSLTVLAAYSGMRREEVAELKVSDIDNNVFCISEGKTAAAVRRVPIHPTIAPLVRRLEKGSSDGFLISGLLRGGPDAKRAWYVGKRFGRAIRKLSIDDPALDFHALRSTVVTQLESAGIPESTIQLIVGHKRQGMTLGVYSAGVPDKVKREALAHVSYGKTLDAFIMQTGAAVTVTPSAKPRTRRPAP